VKGRHHVIDAKNPYDRFNLDFLQKKDDGTIWNGGFNVTDSTEKLAGIFEPDAPLRLIDYLVYRPVPKELILWRDVPNYHPDSLDMEQWYKPLIDYCYDGVWIDGEYFNPLFVYWMNIFAFTVPLLDADNLPTGEFDIGQANYCNIDRYALDYFWKAEKCKLDVAVMGSRGSGKSVLIHSVIDRKYRLFPNSVSIVSSTNEDTTNEAWNKVEKTLHDVETKHPALKLKRLPGGDSADEKVSGEMVNLPDGSTEKRGMLSTIEKIIYGKNPGKTRGKRPDAQFIEEFAAFPPSKHKGNLKACMRESRGSWYVLGSIKKATVYYAGTGGSVENDEAETIFTNPKAHTILPTNDYEIEGGLFLPVHVKKAGTWEKTGCPDIKLAVDLTNIEREAAMSDPTTYLGLVQEYPMTIKEVFTRNGSNNFNQDKLASQRLKLMYEPDVPKPEKGFLVWKRADNGRIIGIEWKEDNQGDIDILEHPHWLQPGIPDAEREPIDRLYVGGCDSIDQGNNDSSVAKGKEKGSELAVLIKKRMLDGAYFRATSNLYVAKYNKRSNDPRDDWDNALKLAYYYHAEINLEYTKINIVGHFRNEGFYHLLKKRPSINLANANPGKETHLIGTTTSSHVIDHQDLKIKAYIDDFYDQIFFIALLEQLQDYDRNDRTKFDLVIAMGLCELADEDFSAIPTKPKLKITEELQAFGYYTDPTTGYKKYGVIGSKGSGESEMQESLRKEAQKHFEHGGVRWVDMTDPNNPVFQY
jgi:hypothetical protein